MDIARDIRAVELVKDRVPFAETGVHERHRIGRDILAGKRLQRPQHITSLLRSPRLREDVPLDESALLFRPPENCSAFVNTFQGESVLPVSLVRLRQLQGANPEFRVDVESLLACSIALE